MVTILRFAASPRNLGKVPNPVIRHALSKKIGTLQVGRKDVIEALLRCRQEIGANPRRYTGVVHQQVNPTESLRDRSDQARAIFRTRDVRLERLEDRLRSRGLGIAAESNALVGGLRVRHIVNGQAIAQARECKSNSPADAT